MEIATHNEKSEMPITGREGISAADAKWSGYTPPLERFVNAQTVAEFLAISKANVLKLTREGKIRSYPYRGIQRRLYCYRLSEVNSDFAALCTPARGTIPPAAPVSQRRKSNG